jgi:hypothetical protein
MLPVLSWEKVSIVTFNFDFSTDCRSNSELCKGISNWDSSIRGSSQEILSKPIIIDHSVYPSKWVFRVQFQKGS